MKPARIPARIALLRCASLIVVHALLLYTACDDVNAGGDTERGDDRASQANDIDGDGVPNSLDEDMDGDGVPNVAESGPEGDIDGDGVPNAEDASVYGDAAHEPGPHGDLDGDGLPNGLDSDDDGDGIPDGVVGLGSCDGMTPAANEGSDCDGYCFFDEGGLQPCDDGAPPGSGQPDSDGDGIPDSLDDDDDNDGIPDPDDDNNNGTEPVEPEPEEPPPGNCFELEFVSGDEARNPRVLLVVDKSGSMNWPFGSTVANDDPCEVWDDGCVSKWETTQEVLGAVVDGLEDTVEFGLMLYPAGGDVCGEGELRESIAPGNADNVIEALNSIPEGEGGTPTAVTLAEAGAVLGAMPEEGGTRAVVLATDGGPNCNASLDGETCRCVASDPEQCIAFAENCLDDVNTVGSAARLNAAGFPVFVIGISGSEGFTDVLNALASAGGTGTAYSAQSGNTLADALEDIAIRVGGCRFDLPSAVSPDDVRVTVNGTDVARDTSRQNGWDLVDPNTIEIFGVACVEASRGGAGAGTVAVETCPG